LIKNNYKLSVVTSVKVVLSVGGVVVLGSLLRGVVVVVVVVAVVVVVVVVVVSEESVGRTAFLLTVFISPDITTGDDVFALPWRVK